MKDFAIIYFPKIHELPYIWDEEDWWSEDDIEELEYKRWVVSINGKCTELAPRIIGFESLRIHMNWFKKVLNSASMIKWFFLSGDYKEVKMKNFIAGLKHQLPLKRFIKNFFITGNAWGMLSKFSHYVRKDQTLEVLREKVKYNTPETARKAILSITKKQPEKDFSLYRCIYCDGYHIGRNKLK